MTLIDGDRIVTVQIYDDEHEEYTEKKMSVIDFIDTYTDEGVTETDVVEQARWIPVSERLPESCGMYIITRKIYDCPDTAPIIMSDESWFDGQNTWHNDNRINHERGYLFDVIAWQPLPEPYKAESEVTE